MDACSLQPNVKSSNPSLPKTEHATGLISVPTRNRANQLFLVFMLLFVASVAVGTGYILMRLRSDALVFQAEVNAIHTRALEDQLTQSFNIVDLMLVNVLGDRNAGLSSEDIGRHFAEEARRIPYLRSLSLLDAQGRIIASSNPGNRDLTVLVDNYLPPATGGQNFLRIGTPWSGRDFVDAYPITNLHPASGNALSIIPVIRGVSYKGGNYVLLAAINPDYFINLFSQKLKSEQSVADVLRYDGTLLLSTGEANLPGGPNSHAAFDRALLSAEFGSFENTGANGKEMLSAFRTSRLFPLVVVTQVARDRALLKWTSEARSLLLVIVPMLLAVLVLSIRAYLRQQREDAEIVSSRSQERRQAQAATQLAANVFTHAREGILITDAAGNIVKVNDSFCRITGYEPQEVLGQNPRFLQSGRQSKEFYREMWQALIEFGFWAGELWNRRKNGDVFAELVAISAVRDVDGKTQNYVGLFSDITLMKEHQQQLEHLAQHDRLTELPNRMLLADRLRQAMAQGQRRGLSLAIAYIDLDGFKAVNDLHSHAVGDKLLITVSQRMKSALRDGDTLARIGGDEFVVVLVDLAQSSDAEPVLERLLQAAADPVKVGEALLHVSASLGVALYPRDGIDGDLLMRNADQAMYAAKQAGRNRFHWVEANQNYPHALGDEPSRAPT